MRGLHLLLLLFTYSAVSSRASTVVVADGRFIGTSNPSTEVDTFMGIQYATVGERFALATLVGNDTFTEEPAVQATRAGPMCYQSIEPLREQYLAVLGFLPQAEECLFLNIFRPSDIPPDEKLSVLIWIHGGGFMTGSGSFPLYDGTLFATEHNVIVVSINYRMGIFGFLPQEDGSGGMNGIHDQIVALQWVQQNIIDFGGDPNSVTLFGQSAGSLSACLLAVSPLAEGLFHRAIMQSGSCIAVLTGPPQDIAGADFRERLLQVTGVSSVGELKNATLFPASSLTGYSSSLDPLLQPTLDGYVLPRDEHPRKLYASNKMHISDFIIGSTSYDDYLSVALNASYVLSEVATRQNQIEWIQTLANDFDLTADDKSSSSSSDEIDALVDQALEAYSADLYYGDNPTLAALQLFGDSLFRCSVRELAALIAGQQYRSVYLYNYAYLSNADLLWGTGVIEAANLTQDAGFASHGSDGSVVFGTFYGVVGPVTPSVEDIAIGKEMRARWASFAKYGTPNIEEYEATWEPVSNDALKKGQATDAPPFIFGPGGGIMAPAKQKAEQCSLFIGLAGVSSRKRDKGKLKSKKRDKKKKASVKGKKG